MSNENNTVGWEAAVIARGRNARAAYLIPSAVTLDGLKQWLQSVEADAEIEKELVVGVCKEIGLALRDKAQELGAELTEAFCSENALDILAVGATSSGNTESLAYAKEQLEIHLAVKRELDQGTIKILQMSPTEQLAAFTAMASKMASVITEIDTWTAEVELRKQVEKEKRQARAEKKKAKELATA